MFGVKILFYLRMINDDDDDDDYLRMMMMLICKNYNCIGNQYQYNYFYSINLLFLHEI